MSSYVTHALIGGTAGLTVYHFAAGNPALIPGNLHDQAAFTLTIGSAILALWPDIDEPNSFISRRVRWLTPPLCATIAASTVLHARHPTTIMAAAAIGLALGIVLGPLLPRLAKLLSGGHRRLTHSLVTMLVLAIGGWSFSHADMQLLGLPLVGLAWGEFLHVIGDVVTPAGVPLLFPFSQAEFHLLPRALSSFGEALLTVLALVLIFLLIR